MKETGIYKSPMAEIPVVYLRIYTDICGAGVLRKIRGSLMKKRLARKMQKVK